MSRSSQKKGLKYTDLMECFMDVHVPYIYPIYLLSAALQLPPFPLINRFTADKTFSLLFKIFPLHPFQCVNHCRAVKRMEGMSASKGCGGKNVRENLKKNEKGADINEWGKKKNQN